MQTGDTIYVIEQKIKYRGEAVFYKPVPYIVISFSPKTVCVVGNTQSIEFFSIEDVFTSYDLVIKKVNRRNKEETRKKTNIS